MPTVLKETYDPLPPQSPPRKRWTRAQCASLEASGIWEREQLELVGGELISKMGKKVPHFFSLHALRRLLDGVFTPRHVYTEIPIDVAVADNPTNEPEPDLVVLKEEIRDFGSNPQPSQLALVVEVADSSLRFDLTVKAELYARAGIEEYWVLDVNNRGLIVHRSPTAGRFDSVVYFKESESAAPILAPHATLAISDMLPPLA